MTTDQWLESVITSDDSDQRASDGSGQRRLAKASFSDGSWLRISDGSESVMAQNRSWLGIIDGLESVMDRLSDGSDQ